MTNSVFIRNYCRIRNHTITSHEGVVFQAGQGSLDDFLNNAYDWLNPAYPKYYKMDRLSKLGFLAAEVLLKGTNLARENAPESVSLVLSNAHSSLDTDVKYFESTKNIPSPGLFVYTLPNIVAGEICIRHGIKGENTFFISEVFDPQLLADYVHSVLLHPPTQFCLAGWIDVMDSHHDVFLYLAEKQEGNSSLQHSVNTIANLYS